jgi:hypothetical protein
MSGGEAPNRRHAYREFDPGLIEKFIGMFS